MPSRPRDPLLDQVLGERWVLRARLGAGAMGAVYRAEDLRGGPVRAVKVLRPQDLRNEGDRRDAVRRFRREAEAMRALNSPYVVRIVDSGEDDHVCFLAMELVEGDSLETVLGRRGRLSPSHAASIGACVARALEAAHAAGVIHRDLKPGNVFLDDNLKAAKVGDFGIARLVRAREGQTKITKTGHTIGSPHYMSPEQATAQPLDHTTDLYALGVLLYETLVGRRPFGGESFVDVAMAHVTEDPPELNLKGIEPAVLEHWRGLIERLLAKDRAERPQHAGRVAEALDDLAATPEVRAVTGEFDWDSILTTEPVPVVDAETRPVGPVGQGDPLAAPKLPGARRKKQWTIAAVSVGVATLWGLIFVMTAPPPDAAVVQEGATAEAVSPAESRADDEASEPPPLDPEAVVAAKSARLVLTSEPAGARVIRRGVHVCTTPCDEALLPGEGVAEELLVRREGYEDALVSVALEDGATATETIRLTAKP